MTGPARRHVDRLALAACIWGSLGAVTPGDAADRDVLTIVRHHRHRSIPPVPSPLWPGAPIPWTGSPLLTPGTIPIVDQRTRFLTEGIAAERCPGDRIDFVPGIVNPFRPTLPGDGAFMCHRDAVAEGIVGP